MQLKCGAASWILTTRNKTLLSVHTQDEHHIFVIGRGGKPQSELSFRSDSTKTSYVLADAVDDAMNAANIDEREMFYYNTGTPLAS
ncbi:hypothetical protein CC2G_013062 [Coprinopsis cinerea AmutBmut pab1-1]|nr:hypothetical protein CC2G_013062 [Coprinopsis cinerea AmutBmut pab1-1]